MNAALSPRILSAWSKDGHLLGNHSFSHLYFSGTDPSGLMADIVKCEPLLSGYPASASYFDSPIWQRAGQRKGATRCARC